MVCFRPFPAGRQRYVFMYSFPNSSKQTYNYEAMDQQQIIRLAQIHSLKETWKDKQAVCRSTATP